MPIDISHAKRGNPIDRWDIIAAKMEKGDMRSQRGLYVADQGQDMHNGDLSGIIPVDATALVTGRSLDNPEMLAELTTVHVYVKLLGPEIKDSKQIVGSTIAIIPAINQAKRLCMPVPTRTRSHHRIHGMLHLFEVVDLVYH